ncbi:hypothetical protein PX699_13260 [Sphingobium sp. H39-3-25]|uniref:hypothetical protein n=1 Tax=Sphingobium arseniciresistens TaxID=3030834 RepID=UPI0023B9A52A|nr:hypothetical protein [Sphingobium arseniciresistens]
MIPIPFALAILRRYWWAIPIALFIAWSFRVDHLRGRHLDSLKAERAGRKEDRAAYNRAQMEATAKAFAQKQALEKEYERKAEVADAAYSDLSGQYRAAVLRYAAAQRAAGRTDLPGATQAPEVSDGSGQGAGIPQGSILIATDDALICAENTARLQIARGWVLDVAPVTD